MSDDAPNPRSVRRILVAAGLLGLGAVIVVTAGWALTRNAAPRPEPDRKADATSDMPASAHATSAARLIRPAVPGDRYVGSDACVECHAEIARTYAMHPMGRSLASIADAVPIEDYEDQTTVSPAGPRAYHVEKTADGVRHHETYQTDDGETLYDQGVEVHYALGSGRRGRAYLIDRGGLLFLSPLNWYSTQGKWDLAPGYHPEVHPRFDRRAIDACLGCHTGRLAFDRDEPDRYGDPPFIEDAIGCERCHGPGEAHIARHRSDAEPGAHDPIVNPAKLDIPRREDVCNQCHLQGEERIVRYGRHEFDFRPGDRLEDIWAVLVGGTRVGPDSTTRAVSQVEQMRASRCYEGSEGRLGCTTCHDPHASPPEEHRAAFYDARCLDCHAEQGCSLPEPERTPPPASGSCIHCHMPALPTHDVPHTSQSDHRIVRRADASPASPTETPSPVGLFDGAEQRLPAIEVDRARGLYLVRLAEQDSNAALAYDAEQLLLPVLAAAPDDLETLDGLATACRLQQRIPEAIDYWHRALELAPERESSLVALAKACHESGRLEDGVAALDRYFRINPWIGELYGRQTHMLGQLGQFERAITAAQRAVELNPTLYQVYGWLSEVSRLRGNAADAARYQKLFRELSE